MKKSTMELLRLIEKTSSFQEYKRAAEGEFIEDRPLSSYLDEILAEKGLEKKEVIRRSGLDRTYAYSIFTGKKNPSRDKVLALCLAMDLSADEAQRLLKTTGYPQLYARIERDSVLLYALDHQMPLMDVNGLLYEMGKPCLG